ncbi:hypothetical protein EHEL_020910 [Encephalitozoon hellem ATCC 50504]|uniref:Uncharacterized protein n=1 Tax=Encephalitozoon hellem TaxID=27973 RepID=A0A9Q9FAW9_ENCHE|nr:uncharacterized protein EHEL_020910 [Encephalitozoon hellem ATCC 50504]AFM97846.1 hypothetical protein EHEL_020910 [Encephalitozoon hellem ATCC 50504]UTX42625.1 hypothetical protein GPU96_02g03380 [Encephalitozoon hellem]|eukprot:XP_003886827.1 hypothetical protein EHEL_020910 [Encephalitozoon hellem ATCC 50504]
MRLLVVSMIFGFDALCSPDESSTKSADNIFKKFLEVAVKDEHHRLLPSKDGKHSIPHAKDADHPAQKKKTVIVVEEDSEKKSVILNPKIEQKLESISIEAEKKNKASASHKALKATSEDTLKPEIQSELTFETPISASFLLKPLGPKKEISLTQEEVREIREGLKALEKISKDLESLRSRLQSASKRILGPEKEEKGAKPPTDLLNYNFIEVTETGQSGKK